MRSGCTLPATVLLLLFLGVSAWGTRHWKPSIICDNSSFGWICTDSSDTGTGFSWLGGAKNGSDRSDQATAPKSGGKKARGVAHPFPWPVADKPRKWTNFRKVAVAPRPAAVAPAAVGAIPWPIADKPRKWTNFRKGAYSVAAVVAVSKTAGAIPWPIADKPRKWTNFRKGAYSAAAVVAVSKTAGAIPWPIADKPRKWTNIRKTPKRKKIAVKSAAYKTVPHPFAWPIAKKPRKWNNFRSAKKRSVTGVAHPFAWPIAKKPRKWSNIRTRPRKASDCSAELNRVARDGVILFETASAKLTDSSYDTLDQLAGVAKSCDRVNIVVEGHTDDRGSAAFNQGLSERRASSVAAYLQGAGVAAGSLSAVGYGESRPAVPNNSAANLAKNRRIEFSVSGR